MGPATGDGRRYCIVNVDDFGISRGVNRGVIEAHRAGIVTSASLMVDGESVADAVEESNRNPGLSVGIHVSLTDEDGNGLVDLDDAHACQAELDRQLDRFRSLLGRAPTHVDSHHHVHRRRTVLPVFSAAAQRLDVPLRGFAEVAWVGEFYGAWDDETHPEQISLESLTRIVRGLRPGVTEISSHIGYVDDAFESSYHAERELELATILDSRLPAVFSEAGVDLIGYRDLAAIDEAPRP